MRSNKIIFSAAIALLCLLCISPIHAQNLNSAYFLEGYSYQHEMNPAFMSERNYIAMPMLGNMNIAVKSNIGVDNFIYKTDAGSNYKLTTFMHPSIDANTFLSDLHDNNKMGISLNTTILGAGFYAFGGFNTIGLSLKTNANINLPYGLFDFMKSGMKAAEGTTYKIEDLEATASSYAELALGHAHKVSENLTIGAKLKFLLGAAYFDAKVDDLTATMSEGKWAIAMNGTVNASMKGASLKTKQEELTQRQIAANAEKPGTYVPRNNQFDEFDIDSPGLGGWGLGVDLGAVYDMKDLVEGMKVSVGVLDLGFINWESNLQASNNGNEGFEFSGFSDIDVNDDGTGKTIEDQVDDLSDQFEEMMKFYDNGDQGKRSTKLATTLNFGIEYKMPFYSKLSAGLLSSTHFQSIYTWTEARLSLNIAPIKWFDASTSIAQSTFGTEVGGVINFHPKSVNFFVGTNRIVGKVSKEFVPIKGNVNFTFGINITFGKSAKERAALTAATTTDVIAE